MKVEGKAKVGNGDLWNVKVLVEAAEDDELPGFDIFR